MQFAGSHKGSCYGDHTRTEGETGIYTVKYRRRAHHHQHDDADKSSRTTTKAVQKGHQLRHLDHLDLVGQEKAEGCTRSNG